MCFRSRKLVLVFGKSASSGTRAASDSQEDPRVTLAAAHSRRLRKPCLAVFSLPSRACCRCLLSQSRKCAFQASCPGLKGSRHVSEMLTQLLLKSHSNRQVGIWWELHLLLFSSLVSHPTGKQDRGPMNRSDVMLISKPSLQ